MAKESRKVRNKANTYDPKDVNTLTASFLTISDAFFWFLISQQCVKKRSPGSLSGVAFLSRTPSKTPTQLTALYRPSDARKSTRTASASGARSRPGGALSPSVKLKVLGNSSGRSTLVPEWPLNSGRPSRCGVREARCCLLAVA